MLLPDPAPDFRDPLGLLAACHGRIENQCATLLRLPNYLAEHGGDAEARGAAAKILHYFSSAAKHHHHDEEEDLFPLLRRIAEGQNRSDMLDLLATLEREHAELDRTWASLAADLRTLAETGRVDPAHLPVMPFVTLNMAHLRRENAEILPFAHAALSGETLAVLGQSMARRRGVSS